MVPTPLSAGCRLASMRHMRCTPRWFCGEAGRVQGGKQVAQHDLIMESTAHEYEAAFTAR